MDVRPAAQGHSLVIPRAHFVNVLDISERLVQSCAVTTQRLAGAIHRALSADGIRVNQYNGRAAGQTVFHYHVHVVPVASGRRPPAHGRDLADLASLENVAQRIRRYL
jgi:histidine triad (HIT) family protein